MASITDRTAYLRGLAEGMKLDKANDAHKLMLEMLDVMDEMAHQLSDMDADVGELQEYVEDIDSDLSDMEDVLFGEEGDEDEEDVDEMDDEELAFTCPHCGSDVMLRASDIDYDESPVCTQCGKPFFTDARDGDK